METTEQTSAPVAATPVRRSNKVETALAGAVLLGVLVQAVLAGQHIALDGPITLHGIIGSGVFTFQLVLVAMLVLRRATRAAIVTAGLLVLLLIAQIGLGYAARGSHDLVALHIPLGVALFGVATWQLAVIRST